VAVDCDYRYLDRQEYDQFLSRRLRDTGNGVRSEWAFDYLGRLETLTTETPERVVQAMTWGYDKADNVVSMDNEVPATVPSLYVGPSSQDFAYDPYYRLKSATGQADLGLGKVRTFTQAMTYDAHGNVTSKKQTDVIGNATGQGPKPLVQAPTTYSFGMQYGGGGPHQLRKNGSRTYTHDANGNLTGFTDSVTKEKRVVTWDAEDRITKIADGKDSTDYRYDADGRRAVERGPDGETLFVNRYYTVRNGSVPWKQVWAGDDRLGSKRSFDGAFEHQQYFFAKDLQGSTNVVTDDIGKVFEHWEYFPGGEPWIREDSNVHRTPHLYAGGYLDEVRDLVNLGERWYEPREGLFYSPDAALHRDPMAAVDDPALLPAYTYAESSPLRLVDPGGAAPSAAGIALQASGIASRANPVAAAVATAVASFRETSSRTKLAIGRAAASDEAKALQAFSDRWSAKPLVAIEVGKGKDGWGVTSVTLSPFGFVEKKVFGGAADRDDGGDAPPRPGTGRRRSPRAGQRGRTDGRHRLRVGVSRRRRRVVRRHDALDRCQVGPVGQLVRPGPLVQRVARRLSGRRRRTASVVRQLTAPG
jgi:RHS repeat-associated protein